MQYTVLSKQCNNCVTKPDTIGADSVIYVNGARAENGDGTSWDTAFNNLESAITAAQADTEIWIAQGTYTPSNTAGDTTATFRITQNNLYLYGGFQGTETSLDQRDPEKYVTIVSGQIGKHKKHYFFMCFLFSCYFFYFCVFSPSHNTKKNIPKLRLPFGQAKNKIIFSFGKH